MPQPVALQSTHSQAACTLLQYDEAHCYFFNKMPPVNLTPHDFANEYVQYQTGEQQICFSRVFRAQQGRVRSGLARLGEQRFSAGAQQGWASSNSVRVSSMGG